MKKKTSKVYWVLDPKTLAELRGCKSCREEPAVFLTAKMISCCRLCWDKLADNVVDASLALESPNVDSN
jgi:hypothetical protein